MTIVEIPKIRPLELDVVTAVKKPIVKLKYKQLKPVSMLYIKPTVKSTSLRKLQLQYEDKVKNSHILTDRSDLVIELDKEDNRIYSIEFKDKETVIKELELYITMFPKQTLHFQGVVDAVSGLD